MVSWGVEEGGRHRALRAEQGAAADCLQRPLGSRFQPQLTPSVAMTSNVKSWSPLFQVIMMLLSSVHRKRRSQ